MYLQEIKEEKIKDQEIKKRTKDELDVQIRDKIKREYEEELRNKEYANIWKNHLKVFRRNRKEKS